ncbi:hypothetical protein PPACK8108_LOCUS3781 [Phakopsora pachyrhizi]|uniref:Uncharacterized protein n=1 Tax=Phakopsora pachyrhizi TaxID=170000 RepID=A0AAV0AKP4_PHAPC|nr:hypothetical protein PPACK8108_LOCUS3781 [Phakopsora pachyrhizi]
MLKKLLVLARISVYLVSQCSGLQGFSHLLPICGEDQGSSLKAVSELSEDYSAFQKVNDKLNQNFMLPTKSSSIQIPDQSSVASFNRFAKQGSFPQNLNNKFYIPNALIHREDQLVKSQEASPLSLGNVIHEDTESSQVRHRSQFYNPEDFLPFDYSSFFSPDHLEEIYPNTLSTESKAVTNQADQYLSSKNLREVNNKNLEPNLSIIWDLYSISSYPAQDTLKMNQISKTKENFSYHPIQANLSNQWKVEINYNKDDQKLLEEMLDSQDNQNFVKKILNSYEEQNVFGETINTHNNQYFREKQFNEPLEYIEKNYNAKNSVNKKRKIFEKYREAKSKKIKAELKKQTTRQKKEQLIEILRINFTIKPMKKDQPYKFGVCPNLKWSYNTAEQESVIQKYLDIKNSGMYTTYTMGGLRVIEEQSCRLCA